MGLPRKSTRVGIWSRVAALTVSTALCLCSVPAMAQQVVDIVKPDESLAITSDVESYPTSFFADFFPQTALDMLQRVPGFTIGGGAELRGFGGGAGNVLIDGARPTIKAGGLEDVLRRIPANAVDRIEISRGAQRAGETAGQSIIANVVRMPRKVAGTWSAELERNPDGLIYPRGEVSVTAPVGVWSTTTRLNAFWEQFVFVDVDRQTFDADGDLLVFEEETLPSTLRDAFISTEAIRPLGGGTFTVNARFGNSRFYQETGRDGFFARLPDGSPDRRTDIRFDSEFWEGELSADWTRTVADSWSLKLLGLGSVRDSEVSSNDRVEAPLGTEPSFSRFEADRVPIELLSRGTIGRVDGAFRPEFGVEVAYNRLDSEIALETEAGDVVTPILLPASDVTVEEYRGEAFANAVWILSPRYTLEAGLAAELSDITVTGDADNADNFFFVKPSLALTYKPNETLQFRAALRRSIGQLDFNDFAASANVEDDRFLGGNPELGPDQTTRASLSGDLRLDSGAALNVEGFHEWREDVLEQVILPSSAAGLANAGSARVWGLDAEASLPLGRIIKGGLLEASAELRDSRFDDPITGEVRDITNLRNPDITVDFRQDLTDKRFAWGVGYESRVTADRIFANETLFDVRGRNWTAFVETTRFLDLKMRLEARGIGDQAFPRDRLFFAPDRSGLLTGSERLDRRRGMFVKFVVSDQF